MRVLNPFITMTGPSLTDRHSENITEDHTPEGFLMQSNLEEDPAPTEMSKGEGVAIYVRDGNRSIASRKPSYDGVIYIMSVRYDEYMEELDSELNPRPILLS